MYFNEGIHAVPHFHARYASAAASVDLDGNLIGVVHVEMLVDVTAGEVLDDYRLRLTFADGTVGSADFTGREWRGVFGPLRDPAYFARVYVDEEAGTIAWPNGADMAPEPLYAQARRTHTATSAPPR